MAGGKKGSPAILNRIFTAPPPSFQHQSADALLYGNAAVWCEKTKPEGGERKAKTVTPFQKMRKNTKKTKRKGA